MGCVNSTEEIPIDLGQVQPGQMNVFGEQYQVPKDRKALLHLKAKFWDWSGEDFQITDLNNNNQVVFKASGKLFSLSDKRTVVDWNNTPVFVIKEKLMQLDDKQSIYTVTPDGKPDQEMFKVSSNFGNTKQQTHNLKSRTGEAMQMTGKMTLLSMKGHIQLGDKKTGTPIAKVCSPMEFQNFAPAPFARDDYLVEICPGADMAAVVAMVLAYEGMESTYGDGVHY